MVKIFSSREKQEVEQAVREAEKGTGAEIAVIVLPSSDHYIDFVLGYGIICADFVTLGLWTVGIYRHFVDLLVIQIAVLLALFGIPFLRRALWRLVPGRVLHRRSANRALVEYHKIHRRFAATVPLVLLFVSLGERYTHVLASHAVYEKISDEKWDGVVANFARTVSSHNIGKACVAAVSEIGVILGDVFPADGKNPTPMNS